MIFHGSYYMYWKMVLEVSVRVAKAMNVPFVIDVVTATDTMIYDVDLSTALAINVSMKLPPRAPPPPPVPVQNLPALPQAPSDAVSAPPASTPEKRPAQREPEGARGSSCQRRL